MSEINNLISLVDKHPDCSVYPPQGIPEVLGVHRLPEDLHEFYQQCGGLALFSGSAYSVQIVPPSKFRLANPVIFQGVSEEDLQASKADISWSWYVIGAGDNGQFITIDLASSRLGRCYDSFWERHALPGSIPIIATSFTELLHRLFINSGGHWYWLELGFDSYGDAYSPNL